MNKNIDTIQSPAFIVVDLFCGAGGTTTGFEMAGGVAKVIACVNHDHKAIKSHWANHPHIAHFEEDIRTLHLSGLKHIVRHYRRKYPKAKLILWASLECTNFSKAKGGQPRDADSRTLADYLDRYILAIKPDYVQIENVVEFMSWGPLDADGKPVSRKNGTDWMKWRNRICSYGYQDEWKQMNSADYGAYTSRNRLFGCFAKKDLPIVWPMPTHAKNVTTTKELFDTPLLKWKAVKDVLDFNDEGQSIFNRKKPLVDASLERIYAGLMKFVAGGKDSFLLKYNSMNQSGVHIPPSTDEPCPTIACQNRLGLVNTSFIAKYYSGKPEGKVIPVTGPAGTIKTKDGQYLVQSSFIVASNGGSPSSKVASVNAPCRVLTTSDNKALVQPFLLNTNFNNVGKSIEEPAFTLVAARKHPYLVTPTSFLAKYHGNGENIHSVDEPATTLSTKDRISKIQTLFISREYKTATNTSINEPLGALLTVPKANLVQCEPFILNPSHGGHTMHTNQPCPVIVARQDKSPLYLIQLKSEPIASIPVYEDDSEAMIRIKEFMVLYGIADIKMRMLKVSELLPIQGFPKDYILQGNQTDQKKFIGNSVVPHVVKCWAMTMAEAARTIIIPLPKRSKQLKTVLAVPE